MQSLIFKELCKNYLQYASQNKRTNYVGKKITIHDNREICCHAATCVENLSSVFRKNEKPWSEPDADESEKIIRVIKNCPSGALSYSIDGTEDRDQHRDPLITIAKDGPYLVTGGIELGEKEFGEGASKEHYTLCRCGASKNKPFCDGMHWEIDFKSDD